MSRRRPSFRAVAAFLFALQFAVSLAAQDISPLGPVAGKELAAALCAMRPVEDADWRGILKISGRNHKTVSLPVTCRTLTTGDSTWTVTYTTGATNGQPAEKLEIHFSTNAPPQYFYARAAASNAPPGDLKALSAAEADIPLGGSDFWLTDLGFQFYHWPDQTRLKGELRRGKSCFVLQSDNPHPAPGGYSRVKVWIEKESGVPLQAETYDAAGRDLKEFTLGSVEKVKDRYELKDLEISNSQTGSRTKLVFDLDTK